MLKTKITTPALDRIHQPVVVIAFALQNVNAQLLTCSRRLKLPAPGASKHLTAAVFAL
jgi:hypothetical protein